MRVAIYTLGCKVNQYETQAMEQELQRRGHTLVDFESPADAYIINTCSVTAVSDKKSRQMIRRAKSRTPQAVVAACGCYVQTHTPEAQELGIDLIGGTGDRMEFLTLLEQAAELLRPLGVGRWAIVCDDTVAALASLGIGDPVGRDCRVDELNSSFLILKRLEKVAVNVDELDYLAKRLDSSDINEAAKFQAMTVKWGLFEMTDLINLTFWCQQARIITDFSDLEDIGRRHYMPLNGGSCSTEELERLDARKAALDLILNSESTCVTPCGVVYDNDMKLEHHYDGQHFPCYLCQPAMLVVGIFPKNAPEGSSETTWLTLPCSEQ